MKVKLMFFLIWSIIISAAGDIIEDTTIHQDYPDQCYEKNSEHLFKPGEEYQPRGRCYVYKCIKPGHIEEKGCRFVRMDECEEIGMDFTKKMPECCPKFSCKDRYGKKIVVNPSMEQVFS